MLILRYALMDIQGMFWSEGSNRVLVCAAGSSVALQVGLVLAALLLFALGAALFVFLYKKRCGQISLCLGVLHESLCDDDDDGDEVRLSVDLYKKVHCVKL